jgi:hypothetical protein
MFDSKERKFNKLMSIVMILVFVVTLILTNVRTVQAAQPQDNYLQERMIIEFGPATDFPDNLDELYSFIETGHRGYDFSDSPCSEYANFEGSAYLDWSMVEEIIAKMDDDYDTGMVFISSKNFAEIVEVGGGSFPHEGMLKISENDLFGILLLSFLSEKSEKHQNICSFEGSSTPVIFGNVQWVLDYLSEFIVR